MSTLAGLCGRARSLQDLAESAWREAPALGVQVGLTTLREAERLEAMGSGLWTGVRAFCDAFERALAEHTPSPSTRASSYFGLEPCEGLTLARRGDEAGLSQCIDQCIRGLRRTSLPFEGEVADELLWAVRCQLAPPGPVHPGPRWRVHIKEGSAHGDLYELEQELYYRVLDWPARQVKLSFTEQTSADLSRSGGGWEGHPSTGVASLRVVGDVAVVLHHNGSEERLELS